ncbi:hypothetical protein P4544_07215 [Halomonas sp. LY9]
MAEQWAKRRELELAAPGGVLTAKWKGVILHDAIERYLHEFAQGKACKRRDRMFYHSRPAGHPGSKPGLAHGVAAWRG